MALGVFPTCSPAWQLVHAVHVAALLAVLNVFAPQPTQTRSLEPLPALPTYWPAVQVFQGVH